MSEDEYNIDNYTDQECFELLNLNNPTDRELEMQILSFMDKYENKSKRLYHFFESMYDRFFSEEEEEVVEGFETAFVSKDDRTTEMDNVAKNLGNAKEKAPAEVVGNATTTISTVTTHNVDYIADPRKLNPVEEKPFSK